MQLFNLPGEVAARRILHLALIKLDFMSRKKGVSTYSLTSQVLEPTWTPPSSTPPP
jgi:hypothetical protein